jgi:hypothetical protein
LAGVKGISAFIAIAIVADIIEAGRFKGSKAFASSLMPAPEAADSNARRRAFGGGQAGALLTQSLNHALNAILKLVRRRERAAACKKAGLVGMGLRRRVFAEVCQTLEKGERRYGGEARKREFKMAHYRSFLKKREKTRNMRMSA